MEVPTGKPMLFYAKQFDTAHTKSIQKACSPSRIRSLFENQELFLAIFGEVWNVVIKPNLNQLQYHHKCVKPIPKLNVWFAYNTNAFHTSIPFAFLYHWLKGGTTLERPAGWRRWCSPKDCELSDFSRTSWGGARFGILVVLPLPKQHW